MNQLLKKIVVPLPEGDYVTHTYVTAVTSHKRVLLVPPAGGALEVLAPLPGGQFGDECRFHLV